MNEKANKQLEELTDKLMKDASLESPSLNFTDHVMSKVEAFAKSNVTTYKPLISKPVWFGLLTVVIGVLVASLFSNTTESSLLSAVDLSVITNNGITKAISSLNFSKSLAYAVGIFALMFAVQIPLLKGYFDRRLGY